MTTLKTLEDNYSTEPFDDKENRIKELNESIKMMQSFVEMEQCVAVLSDLAEHKSHVFVGAFGEFLGLEKVTHTIIDSIWEEDIYNKIHPDDLFERHLLELEFYNFLKPLSPEKRLDYSTQCRIRAKNLQGHYQYITHRSRYIKNSSSGGLWLDVCLYNYTFDSSEKHNIDGQINNLKTGESIMVHTYKNCSNILSIRESEVLQCVSNGLLSKEIASQLNVSINTINRHRQNILEKLKVNNSIEAVKTAKALRIIS